MLIVLGWHLASFQSWNSKRPRNTGGFVHSPALWKQRLESAVNQKQHGMNGAALPCRRGFVYSVSSANSMNRTPSFSLLELPSTDAIAYCLSFPHNYSWHQ
ncbi:unnamed protein product [Penicillium salamii]|nr:unnamed protein product [Penicillium salamii]